MKKNGKCPSGQYYCYTDKKCKPIPQGFKAVGRAGYLRKENGHSVDDENKNGNGNGNGDKKRKDVTTLSSENANLQHLVSSLLDQLHSMEDMLHTSINKVSFMSIPSLCCYSL